MEENVEYVVEETTQVEETPQQEQQEQQVEEKTPEIDLSKFESADDPDIIKVDLSKSLETENNDADTEQETTSVVEDKQPEIVQEVVEEVSPEQDPVQDEKQPVIEEVTEEQIEEEIEQVQEQVEEAVAEAEATGKPIPENIQKLMDFMNETGGDLQDYVRLNQDYSDLDENSLLREYYKQSKPHLNDEEISFLMEDQFSYDEEEDSEREIRRKKLALKEQVASAKAHLDGQKSKY